MAEATVNQLEQKRFIINPESLNAIQRVKNALPDLRKQYPYLSGVSFFGSRTKGKEHEDSDLDLCIFYDSAKSLYFTPTYGGLVTSTRHVRKEELAQIKGKIRQEAGLRLDTHVPIAVDISKESTDRKIRVFSEFVDEFLDKNTVDENLDDITSIPPTQDLIAQFFLAVGEDVYKNRAYIMNQFKQMPQGEKYFQVLMKCLGQFERGKGDDKYSTPHYGGLPMTIEDAEKYFLTGTGEKRILIAA